MRKKTITQEVYKGVKTGLKTSSVFEQMEATGLSSTTIKRIQKSKNFKDYKEIVKAQHHEVYIPSIYVMDNHELPRRSLWDKLKSLFS